MAPPLLHLRDIALTFGHKPLLDGVDLVVGAADRLCLVGRNGSGKSTLMRIAAGQIEPDAGSRWLQPDTTIRYLPQEVDFAGHASVGAFVEAGLAEGDDAHAGQRLMEALGMTGSEATATLSGGEARRAAIARTLAPAPDILLLDEPTNHLDLPAIEWLEQELTRMRSAIVLISHDRRFLTRLSRATVWLDRGTARQIDKGFAAFEDWRDTVLAEERTAAHKLDRKLAQEADWLRYGVTARRKRNQGRLRRLHALRAERRAHLSNRPTGKAVLQVQEARTPGKLVIEAETISKSFGGLAVVREFSTRIARGDKIGIVGPNGSGKTTLLRMLTGVLEPDTGTTKLGTALNIVTLDQRREGLAANLSLAETLTEGRGDQVMVGEAPRHVIGYMRDFLFTADQAASPVSSLSGGERGRLMLARALARPSNLLVLDEPTNDLDLETLDLLQDMLAEYPGTVLLVSHDRDFLDRVVTSIIAAEGAGHWTEYAGGYSDMLSQRGKATDRASRGGRSKSHVAPRTGPVAPSRKRLTFKDKHALETLPGTIEALHGRIAALEEALADPDLYARDPERFVSVTADLTSRQAELAAAEDRWLELEILKEETEGGPTEEKPRTG